MRNEKGQFVKGFKHTEESKKKIIKALTGRPVSKKVIEKITGNTYRKGIKHTDEFKKAVSFRHSGKVNSIESRIKMSKSKLGENNPNWKGGISTENQLIRGSMEYKLWRESVFTRDNYTCVWCFKRGGWSKEEKRQIEIQADHIKPFASYPELRFAIDNGRTLCIDCHRTTDTWGFKKQNVSLDGTTTNQ
jgi:hypothetical protein